MVCIKQWNEQSNKNRIYSFYELREPKRKFSMNNLISDIINITVHEQS